MMTPEGKVVIITGASKGIGKAITYKLAARNMKLILAARNRQSLEQIKEELNKKYNCEAHVIPTDLTIEREIKNLVEKTIAIHDRIDILINNAGVGRFARVDEFTIDDYNFMFDINMKGLFLLTKYVVPYLIKQESGHIINISSIAGKNGFKSGTLYSATKHAVQGFTWSLREDLKQYKIKVTAVCPGSVVTEFGNKKPDFVEWSMDPEDIAHACDYLVTESPNVNTAELIIKPRFNPRNINWINH